MSLYREKPIKKTRKPHYCFGCEKTISTGNKAFYTVCVSDGKFMRGYFCDRCHSVMHDCDEFKEEYEDQGIAEGDIAEHCRECEESETCKTCQIKEVSQ